jgi:hypothetical protein
MSKPGAFKRIPPRDITVSPFKVYKSWRFTTTSSLDEYGIDRLVAIKPDKRIFEGHPVAFGHWTTIRDTGSFLVNTKNDKEASLIWYSIDHLYYKRTGAPFDTFGFSDPEKIERMMYDEAFILSVPQKMYGEQIKAGSVKLYLKNSQLNDITMSLVDDGRGNLIDTALSSSISNEIFYLGFNSYTYGRLYSDSVPVETLNDSSTNSMHVDTIIPNLSVPSKNVRIVPRYNLPSSSIQWGNAAYFSGNGYMRVPNNEYLNFKIDQDFAISLWVHRVAANSEDSYILSKRTTGVGEYFNRALGKVVVDDVNYKISQYPFDIYFKGSSGNLVCRQSSAANVVALESSNIPVGSRSHVLFNKTGSKLELYVNGQLNASSSINIEDGFTQNEADIFIGSLGLDNTRNAKNAFSGALDEIMIFNKGLNSDEALQLAFTGSMNLMTTNTNVIGNVFYEHGLIVISDPRPKYGTSDYRMFNDVLLDSNTNTNLPSYLESIRFEFNSQITIYEHEYVIKIREDEFNFTTNPTIRKNNDPNSQLPKDFVSNPKFAPYITTIGLYNKNAELVAIAKLASPIHKRDDVDLNILVKFDVMT